jgi:CheY-like chemotaxis protein
MVLVLVVDDENDIRQALAEVLAFEGFVVEAARDGMEALEKVRALHPRLVLLDLMMPRMNGWEFRRAQKDDPDLARIPVLIISAFAPTGDLEAEGYIEKPFDVEELVSAVRRHTAQAPAA